MKTLMPFIILFVSFVATAAEIKLKVISKVKVQEYELGIGSSVELNFIEENYTLKGIFVGHMVNHPDYGNEFLFLNERTGKVLMVDSDSVQTSIKKSNMQPLISTIDQAGETCAAYAIYHFWQQMSELNVNEILTELFSMERSRMKFLEESITSYYMGRTTNLNLIMNKFGKRFEYKCREKIFEEGEAAAEFVFNEGQNANPVMMEFFIGPTMAKSPNQLKDFESDTELDDRLWIPRKEGEKNAGGHAIVAAASFMLKGKRKIVVLDSNWNEPRIWDADSYLGGKTAISEMIFHACY